MRVYVALIPLHGRFQLPSSIWRAGKFTDEWSFVYRVRSIISKYTESLAVAVESGGCGQEPPCADVIMQDPYWKTFNPYVEPLLERPMDLRRFNELEENK